MAGSSPPGLVESSGVLKRPILPLRLPNLDGEGDEYVGLDTVCCRALAPRMWLPPLLATPGEALEVAPSAPPAVLTTPGEALDVAPPLCRGPLRGDGYAAPTSGGSDIDHWVETSELSPESVDVERDARLLEWTACPNQ